jgi:L-rhamnose mutarotase
VVNNGYCRRLCEYTIEIFSDRLTNFHYFNRKYTIWLPKEKKDLFSIANVFDQKKNITHLTNDDLKRIQNEICSNHLYSSFTFVRRSTLSKYNYMQFVLLDRPQHIAYLISPNKHNENCFHVYDPFDSTKNIFEKN